MPFWVIAAIVVVSIAAMILLAPKPKIENAKASNLGDLKFPQSEEGTPTGIWWGRKRLRAPNVLWYGDFEARPIREKVKTGLFSSKRVTVGFEYFVGFQLGLGIPTLSTARVYGIWWGDDKKVWTGDVTGEPTTISINLPTLLGGKKFGGGIGGPVRFYRGSFTHPIDSYLAAKVSDGSILPAYRGLAFLVFEHFMIGESTNVAKISVEAETIPNLLGTGGIGDGDANPAEVLYDILNNDWGRLGLPVTDIDEDSFLDCAQTLFDEGHGIALEVQRANDARDIMEEVLKQIDGLLYEEPTTREITMKLIRKDYAIEDLPIFDKSNIIEVTDFSTGLWDETYNEVRVVYEDRGSDYVNKTAIAQDNSNISFQGKKRSTTFKYPGISNGALASKIASRELAVLSVPLAKMKIKTNREGALLRPGSVIIIVWPDYEIEQLVMRVQKFNLGELDNGIVTIELVEDKFSTEFTLFGTPPSSGWQGPSVDPAEPVTTGITKEAPYFFFQDEGIPAGRSGIITAAEPPTATTQEYSVYTSTDGGANYGSSQEGLAFTEIGTLSGNIAAATGLATGQLASITVINMDEVPPAYTSTEVGQGFGMFLIGNELFAYQGRTDNGGGSVTLNTVWRALLDTAPEAHVTNDLVYFLDGDNVVDDNFLGTAALKVKLLTKTSKAALDLDDAPVTDITLTRRTDRPLPPGNVKWDGGAAFAPPATGTGAHTVTWANRSRLSTTVRKLNDNTSENEAGQQTVLRWRMDADPWTEVTLAPGITSYTFTAGAGTTLTYELKSTRDGLDSRVKWTGASGGSSTSGDTSAPDDDVPPHDSPVDQVAIVFPFGEDIGTYAIDIPLTLDLDIAANFGGFTYKVQSNPLATKVFDVELDGVAVGTFSIATSGVITGSTSGLPINAKDGQVLSIIPPAIVDGNLAGLTITIPATKAG